MLSIIVATATNYAIGKDNNLLWHISEDLKYFKRVTSGHTIIMGKNTFLSIGAKPLPKRRNIVVSRSEGEGVRDGVEYFHSLQGAIENATALDEEVFIIGGGMVYKDSLPLADKLYITEVEIVVEDADTYFPVIDKKEWRESSRSEKFYDEKSQLYYSFVEYLKV